MLFPQPGGFQVCVDPAQMSPPLGHFPNLGITSPFLSEAYAPLLTAVTWGREQGRIREVLDGLVLGGSGNRKVIC